MKHNIHTFMAGDQIGFARLGGADWAKGAKIKSILSHL